MPMTAKDFKIYNSTPEYIRQLDQAFDYFRAKYGADAADAVLSYLRDNNVAIMNNSIGNPYVAAKDAGADLYGHIDGHDVILWDPSTGILVTQNGQVTGIESAADGFIHEAIGHGLNPANDAMLAIPDAQYETANERVAVGIESVVNAIMGEPQRDNHDGQLVWTSDVTVHTITTEDGALQLVRTDANGHDIYGPQIDYASSGWQHLEHAFDAAQTHASNNTGGTTELVTTYNADGSADNFTVSGSRDSGSQDDGNYILHDTDGNAWLFHVTPAPVILLDPHNGNQTDPDPNPVTPPWENGGEGGGEGEGGSACVATTSFLPDGRRAGDIAVGDTMELADQHTLEQGSGRVSYSQEKYAFCYRITTASGATLVCSDTAPIPVRGRAALMTPVDLLGEEVAVRHDDDGIISVRWEKVTDIEEVGRITVQHITVGDKCFWAGEQKHAFILHHNLKQAGGDGDSGSGDGNNFDWFWTEDKADIVRTPSDGPATLHHIDTGPGVPIVGVPPLDAGLHG